MLCRFRPATALLTCLGTPVCLAGSNLLRLAVTLAAIIDNASSLGVSANISERGNIVVVLIDARHLAAAIGSDTVHDDGPRALAIAVATGAVDLAVVVGVEVDYVDRSAAVVLDDLVVGTVGTASDDEGFVAGGIFLLFRVSVRGSPVRQPEKVLTYDRDGIFADILKPDVLESTGAHAMDTLHLVGANNDVLQGRAGLKNEDSIIGAWTVCKSLPSSQ